MTEQLSIERFRDLADAYGGTVARWPEEVRVAAMRQAAEPAFAVILAGATALDDQLDKWFVPAPGAEFSRRIVGAAPAGRRKIRGGPRLLWSGIGVAAALTGAAAGIAGAAIIAPAELAVSDMGTAFGDVASQES